MVSSRIGSWPGGPVKAEEAFTEKAVFLPNPDEKEYVMRQRK